MLQQTLFVGASPAKTSVESGRCGGLMELMVMCLDALIKNLEETGHTCETKRVIDVFYEVKGEKRPIASIYPDDKYVSFHDEFTQLGIDVPGMRDLLCNGGWDSDHT